MKFVKNLGKRLPENVVLKGPSGSIWNVGLVLEDDELFFKRGWKDFVEAYFLEENDVLVFKYNGESSFDVLMFNYASLCEKEASYFQRKSERELVEEDEQLGPKKKHRGTTTKILHTPLASRSKHASEEYDNEGDGSEAIPFSVPILNGGAGVSCRGRIRKETLFCKPVSKGTTPKDVTMSAINGITDDEAQLVISKKSPSSYPTYKTHRKPVTEEAISSALDLAKDAVTSDGFLVVMRPTHVYKKFYLSVPAEWGRKHLENKKQGIILRVEEETWKAKYSVTDRGTRGLTTGWKAFSLDNNLEEFDVCVFDLAESIDDTVVLDVTIFRVVKDVVPQTGQQ